MTTKREYFCNVCRDQIDTKSGIGFKFRGAGLKVRSFEVAQMFQCENHLCYKCISAICDLYEKEFPQPKD